MKYTAAHTPVIRDLSFTVQPGERVGIVGRTGKCFIYLFLMRFTNKQNKTKILKVRENLH